jgi:hypothetical protein
MKNKSLKLRLSYFFRQRKRIYGENMPDLVKSERTESVIEDILRWADDGGKMLPLNSQVRPGHGSGTSKRMINEGR